MITKTKLCISLSPGIVKRINKQSREKNQAVSKTIEEMLLLTETYKKEIVPQLREVRALLKQLKAKEQRKK